MEHGTKKRELVLVNLGTKLEKIVDVISTAATGRQVQKRLVIEWRGAGQAQYVLDIGTNTLHKMCSGPRLAARAGLWQAKDTDLARRFWYELRKEENNGY